MSSKIRDSLDGAGVAAPALPPAGMSLGRLLHGLGALVVVAAFSVFLFQQWGGGHDLARYGLLLGNTLLLAVAGFASGLWLREGRGARLLVGLALAALPVNFAILGALSLPYLGGGPAGAGLPGFVVWDAGGSGLAWGAIGVSMVVLGAAAWLAYRVLARRSALPLLGLYGLANGALLVPTRDGALVATLLLVLTGILAAGAARLGRRDPTLATGEGRFARAVLALPLVVLGGRSLWLYGPHALLDGVLALLAYAAFRELRRRLDGHGRGLWVLELGALGAALAVVAQAGELLPGPWVGPWTPTLLAGLLGLFLLDLGRALPARAARYQAAAAWLVMAAGALSLQVQGGLEAALPCLVVSMAVAAWGYRTRAFALFAAGAAGTLVALASAVHEVVDAFSLGGWTGLALLGVAFILAGSLLERRGERLGALVGGWRSRFATAPGHPPPEGV